MSFGRMPIANGFLSASQIPREYFFELSPAFCEQCGMFQIVEQPPPEMMFHENYAFYSGTSLFMRAHFEQFAKSVLDEVIHGRDDPFVVEIGSNDGIMLRHFKARGIRHLGVEPSVNVCEKAREAGVETIAEFFSEELAHRICGVHGRADAVLAANVMCHIADLSSVVNGIKLLLKSDGVLIFEDPYLGEMIRKTSYDQIYDEHAYMFSAHSVIQAFGRHGLNLIDVSPHPTHGGSMRYALAHSGGARRAVSPRVEQLIAQERAQGLDRMDTYLRFGSNCETSRMRLIELLEGFSAQGRRVVGYGATSKSTTVTNYCGITPKHVEFISDTTPIKQGKLSPGAHIPVKPPSAFHERYPEYALLFAWNHAAEIREKERAFLAGGGRWIVYVPEVDVLA
jgi:methylation protein EvaC